MLCGTVGAGRNVGHVGGIRRPRRQARQLGSRSAYHGLSLLRDQRELEPFLSFLRLIRLV